MSGSEDEMQQDEQPRYSRRGLFRNFVFLEEKRKCVPTRALYDQLKEAGRVKPITFTRNDSSAVMKGKMISHFPALKGKNFSR